MRGRHGWRTLNGEQSPRNEQIPPRCPHCKSAENASLSLMHQAMTCLASTAPADAGNSVVKKTTDKKPFKTVEACMIRPSRIKRRIGASFQGGVICKIPAH